MAETTVPIPGPPGLPIVGNVGDIDPAFPLGSMNNMAETYGLSPLLREETAFAVIRYADYAL